MTFQLKMILCEQYVVKFCALHCHRLHHWAIDYIISLIWKLFYLCRLKSNLSRNFKIFWAEISVHLGQQFLTWCLVSLLTAGQVQLESPYNRSSRIAKLGSSFDFSWNYTGDLRKVEWGTKKKDADALDVTLLILDRNGRLTPNVSQYNDRRFGSWNQQLSKQVTFTLKPIKEVDNQVFIFRFVPMNNFARRVFDVVQLIVKGRNFHHVINCCFITKGSMKLQWALAGVLYLQNRLSTIEVETPQCVYISIERLWNVLSG